VAEAEDVEISQGIGKVSSTGDKEVSPGESTDYVLKAKGPGGDVTQSVRLTVMPPQPESVTRTPGATLFERLAREVSDIHFGYDRYTLDSEAIAAMQKNVEVLRRIFQDFPDAEIAIEGHCDERGSAEYNLGLGERRANAAREYLEKLGLNTGRLRSVSLGKERPQCTEATEDCWRRNRRVRFTTADR
jgi:peptidoglycan-associated lipoprotein